MPARPDPASVVGHPLFRVVRWSVRAAWTSCALGVLAMLPALVLLSPACVTVYRLGIGGCVVAALVALLASVPLVARPDRGGPPTTVGARADALVAALLAELLDDA